MMLDEAREQMYEQKSKFNHRKKVGDKAGYRRAAAKFARAKGMVDMLIWVIGERGFKTQRQDLKMLARTHLLTDTLLRRSPRPDSTCCQDVVPCRAILSPKEYDLQV